MATFSKIKAQSSKLKTSSNLQVSDLKESWKDRDLELGVWSFRQASTPAPEFALRPSAKHRSDARCSLSPRAGHYPQVVRLDTGAVLSAREDRWVPVPKGQSRIAPDLLTRWK